MRTTKLLFVLSLALCGFGQPALAQSDTLEMEVATPTSIPYNALVYWVLGVTGGHMPHVWSVSDGNLPPGLAIQVESNGRSVITGHAAVVGSYPFVLTVTDAQGVSLSKAFDIDVAYPAFSVGPDVMSLYGAQVGVPFSHSLSGGQYTWNILTDHSPPGMTLNSNGTIVGTSWVPGKYTFDVLATDSLGRIDSTTVILPVCETLPFAYIDYSAPAAALKQSYAYQLRMRGGIPPYNFSVASGALPPGIKLSASGLLSGIPSKTGYFSVRIRVKDSGTNAQPTVEGQCFAAGQGQVGEYNVLIPVVRR